MKRTVPDSNVNLKLQYPYSDKFEYQTFIERIDLDKEREIDIKSGKGFIIREPQGIKNDIKLQDGIFSSRYGNTLQDADSFIDRYRCDCGATKGAINHGMRCDLCGTMVKFVDDDMSIFGWMVIKEPYFILHPNLYMSLQAFIGATRLDNIINPKVEVDEDGREIEHVSKKKDEPFEGIGMMEFRRRFDEVMDFYLKAYPHKKNFYDDIKANRNILFTHSIPVFTTLLRPIKLDNASLKYEQTNEDYQMLNQLVFKINDTRLAIRRKKKQKLLLMYDAQTHFNAIYIELKEILSKKKGDIRSSIGKFLPLYIRKYVQVVY